MDAQEIFKEREKRERERGGGEEQKGIKEKSSEY